MVPNTISGLGSFGGLGNFRIVPLPVIGAAYFAGGQGSTGRLTTVDKFSFTDDTRSTLATGLSVQKNSAAGFANSGTAGYVAGGYTTTQSSSIEKFTFDGDLRSSLSATLSQARYNIQGAGMSNSGTAGYVAGGGTGGTPFTSIDKILYSGDTRSTLSSVLSPAKQHQASFSNSGTAGYATGGYSTTLSTSNNNNAQKLSFSTDVISSLGSIMSSRRAQGGAVSNSGTAGYAAGGYVYGTSESVTNSITSLTFSNDTSSNLSETLATATNHISGSAKSGTAGYFGGGFTSNYANTVYKLLFSNNAVSTLGSTLSVARNYPASFANSGTL